MNLEKLSIAELNSLKISIDHELVRRKESEKSNFIKELGALAQARGYALDELLGAKAKKTKGGLRKPAGIKYQHPDNTQLTWSGRGRQPAWIKDWVASGKGLEKLAASNSA
jgi:DNA-binding protein H-NS